jgi:acetyl-CoA carboxylase biotin carboxylase subunit
VRDDGGAYPGCTISSYYDPLISKLCVLAPTREQAIARMRRALSEYVVTGIQTNLPFHAKLLSHPEFVAGRYDTQFLERHEDVLLGPSVIDIERAEALSVAIAVAAARIEIGGAAVGGAGQGLPAEQGRQGKSRIAERGSESSESSESRSRLSPWVAHHRRRRG